MTADIRTAAQREAKRLRVTSNGREYGMAKLYKDAFVDGAVWGATRVTPTREQIAEVLVSGYSTSYERLNSVNEHDLRVADAVLALLQELAERDHGSERSDTR